MLPGVSFKEFVKNPIAAFMFICLVAIGYLYFDTGVMYRAITWAAINKGIDPGDEEKVTSLAESVEIEILPSSFNDGRDNDILLDGEDITWEIRRPEVDSNVSVVSAFPGVRTALTSQQRRIGQRGKVIMVGRDIGTVVALPRLMSPT